MYYNIMKIIQVTKIFKNVSLLDFMDNNKFDDETFLSSLNKYQLITLKAVLGGDLENGIKVYYFNYASQKNNIAEYSSKFVIDNRFKTPKEKEAEEKKQLEKISDYMEALTVLTNIGKLGSFNTIELGLDDCYILVQESMYNDLLQRVENILETDEDEEQFERLKFDIDKLIHLESEILKREKSDG